MRICILFLCSLLPLGAATFVNGGQLLTQADADQLATWFGQGDLSLDNIFSSTPVTNGSVLFHTAADGQGPTFVVLQTNLGLVGGYNPQSWGSSGNYNITLADNQRTAFIFNLSTTTQLRQLVGPGGDFGQYQAYNLSQYGPAFGGGHDLVVNVSNLASGYAYAFSYGNGMNGTNLFGSTSNTPTFFTVSRLEAYTFTVTPTNGVPEPATFLPAGTALFLLASRTFRQRRKSMLA